MRLGTRLRTIYDHCLQTWCYIRYIMEEWSKKIGVTQVKSECKVALLILQQTNV